ncbi:n-acyl homoserine lactonase [Fusarium heterosporum]|uniref:N-acyl homoserine lactonase n=1 Tax=Fusarium heterosporum TaxID=42747 RepID=A0A8H5TYI2_FUSHE|nr:n-acyl homoserine lactonase [Fusarium heterosporum]
MGSLLPSSKFVTVHALEAGWFSMPEKFFVTPLKDINSKKQVPSLSFLVQHHDPDSSATTRILFDLGLRRDIDSYSPSIRRHVETRLPISGLPDVATSLGRGDLTPDDVDLVILSHLHWDHVGTPRDFTKSQFVVGNGAVDLLQGKQSGGSHNHFEYDLLPQQRTTELHNPKKLPLDHLKSPVKPKHWTSKLLEQPWRPVGPFPFGLDVFSDGSLYIIWAPGHSTGHINLLCRKEDATYVYLAGDAAHDIRLLSGEKSIALWKESENRVCCIHQDAVAAQETLSRIRKAWDNSSCLGSVEVVLAHDPDWASEAKTLGRFFPGMI